MALQDRYEDDADNRDLSLVYRILAVDRQRPDKVAALGPAWSSSSLSSSTPDQMALSIVLG
ncbi:MAG: hypothetical protein ACI9ZF_001779 [Bradyrhizobium sp.]|jgi:hypothetical protein